MVVRFFAYAFAEAFLGEAVFFQQVLIGERYFHGVQVFALYVFDECHFHDILVVGRTDIGRGCLSARPFVRRGSDVHRQ